jgi:hypothetical protein
MSKSLNQIISRLESISVSHTFINRFGFGELSDVDVEGPESVDYPLMFCVPQQSILESNTLTYTIRVIIMDIDDIDDTKRDEIMSDTLRTLTDVVKEFKDDDEYEWNISEAVICTPFSQRFVDYTTGWFADINIITDSNNNPCNIPN